jgi:hypothetical protein
MTYTNQTVEYYASDSADLGVIIYQLDIQNYNGDVIEVIDEGVVVADGYDSIQLSSG